jgi:NAD(P)-dependent dehydrogenase (short-subunit alcohol dehydrogenase family)
MRRQGYGRIVNVSSMGGKLTFPGAGYYHATKHAVEALSDALRFEVQGFGVKVSVIEPGLIRTDFAETAVGSMYGSDGENPYAGFDESVAKATAENYERGPFARLGGGPEAVAEAIDHAVSVRSPRSRYAVTPSAHLFLRLRRLLPDRAWDAALRTIYPQPER